jgi:hypothetical protein
MRQASRLSPVSESPARARRDRERRQSSRVLRVWIGAELQQGRDDGGVLAFVRAAGPSQRRLLVADGNVQIEPPRNEKPGDRPVGVQRAEALCIGGLGALIKQEPD